MMAVTQYDDVMFEVEKKKRRYVEDANRTACINMHELQSILINLRAAKTSMDSHGLTFQEHRSSPQYSKFIREHYLSNKKIQELCDHYEC